MSYLYNYWQHFSIVNDSCAFILSLNALIQNLTFWRFATHNISHLHITVAVKRTTFSNIDWNWDEAFQGVFKHCEVRVLFGYVEKFLYWHIFKEENDIQIINGFSWRLREKKVYEIIFLCSCVIANYFKSVMKMGCFVQKKIMKKNILFP